MWDNTGNTEDDNTDFPDLIEHAHLMAWLCLIAFVGYLIWMVLL